MVAIPIQFKKNQTQTRKKRFSPVFHDARYEDYCTNYFLLVVVVRLSGHEPNLVTNIGSTRVGRGDAAYSARQCIRQVQGGYANENIKAINIVEIFVWLDIKRAIFMLRKSCLCSSSNWNRST